MKSLATMMLVLFPLAGFCASETAQALFNELTKIQALQARFDQTISDHEAFVLQESSGRLLLQRPSKLYWQTEPPYEQLIVSNGQKLWVYDPDLEQVTVYDDSKLLQGPVAILTGSAEELNRKYSVDKQVGENAKQYSYVLTPKALDRDNETKQSFEQLVFEFSGGTLSTIKMQDKLHQTTVIALDSVVLNDALDPQVFEFSVPEGTDIVENR